MKISSNNNNYQNTLNSTFTQFITYKYVQIFNLNYIIGYAVFDTVSKRGMFT